MSKKKMLYTLLGCILLLCNITGCNQTKKADEAEVLERSISADSEADTEFTGKDMEVTSEKSVQVSLGVEELKKKYAGSERVEYTKPLYNLPKDHKFVYENVSDAFFRIDDWHPFKVFRDTNFTDMNCVDINIEMDIDTNSVTISPNMVFSYDEDYNLLQDGTWGSRSKFYLVQYHDLQTGEVLPKPLVTVFTIANELTAPTVKQGVAEDGYYMLSWVAVEGADYYEVYGYDKGVQVANLELTTEDTSCKYSQFKTQMDYTESWDIFAHTEVADADMWGMNDLLDTDTQYFVVAKSEDGKHSGMSNFCNVEDVANQIPLTVSDDFQTDYEGDNPLVLPAYAKVKMLDGSNGMFLIEYHNATIYEVADGSILVEASFKKLPIYMKLMTLRGMDFEEFMETNELSVRGDMLATKSTVAREEFHIPYLPDKGEDFSKENSSSEIQVTAELEDTVFSTSALGEWLAINMLNHNENISLADFNEASDSEHLLDVVLEAYNQNPLIGIMKSVEYHYESNSLLVEYELSEEETKHMQTESLKKVAEITSEIITEDMSDYEKEEAINRYLCENASYNDEVMRFIDEKGTMDPEATAEHVNSFTPYGVLCENVGVCESYAEAFLLMARAVGLETVVITGKADNVDHEWNRVKIEDDWYSLDVTNNDREILPNSYFNLPDELAMPVLKQSKDALTDASISKYVAEGMDNEYYVKEGRFAKDRKAASKLLVMGLEKGNVSTIRIDAQTKLQEVEDIIRDAVAEAELKSGNYYYASGVLSLVE